MKKFSFVWFAAFATTMFTFALGFVAFRFYTQRNELVKFYEKEQVGIQLLYEISTEILRLSTPLDGDVPKSSPLIGKLDYAVFNQAVLGPLTETEATTFQSQLEHSRHSPGLLRSLETLNEYRSFILDKSNLILDPQFQAYHLIDALFVSLPKIFYLNNSLEQLQHDLRSPAFRQSGDIKIWQEVGIKKTFLDHMSESIEKVFAFSPADPGLQKSRESLLGLKWEFVNSSLALFDSLVNRPDQDIGIQLEQMRGQAERILELGVEGLTKFNNTRLAAAKLGVYTSLAIAFVLWILSLGLVYLLVRRFLSTSQVMETVITDQKKALVSAQKLAMFGELTAGIGHDIANPLAVIQATTSVIEKHFGKDQPSLIPYLERIYRMVERINAIIKSMKSYLTNDDNVPIGDVDLVAAFNDVRLLTNHRIKNYGIELETNIPPHLHHIVGNESEIVQLFVNLISNAVDAVKGQKDPKIVVSVIEKDSYVFVHVKDNGPGVPMQNREKIFEPLFTTKEKGEGTGLGLAICQRIIDKCHGRLELLEHGPGACFQIRLNIYAA
ncbi:sensor histidine kinase [Bdellovibrio sp. HCB337]|uniref:sensor histidine kinase n=1 Tax=Bdellovibrio sp. HCB337 TaxID=3394358 RepID=UPI0039A4AB9E